ncbi:MAG: serpin family protein [Bacteroidales bacterium]|jgi:serpin B|nr:serpin family protein [Bacteroidales bacterium]
MKVLPFFLLLLPITISCGEDEGMDFPAREKEINLTPESGAMVTADNQFGFELFKRMLSVDSAKNLMISPVSISQALLMTYNGSAGETKNAFEETLFLGDLTTEEINQAQQELVNALLEVDPAVTLNIANSIWHREGFPVNPEFMKVILDFYTAEIMEAAFDQSTVDLVNRWVEDETGGKIDHILDQIDPSHVMFLINAIYFNGNWKYQFEASNTLNDEFYLSNGSTVNVPFMNQEVNAALLQHDDFTILDLPYGRGNFSMLFFLPGEDKTIDDLMAAWNTENYDHWLEHLEEMNVAVSIPKFKFGYAKELDDFLQAMGLAVAFDPDHADFSNLTEAMQLYIDFVKHKSFIDVNEKGTEAAAVTAVGFGTTSADPSYPEFVANRPFLFALREKQTHAILFLGKVANPAEE